MLFFLNLLVKIEYYIILYNSLLLRYIIYGTAILCRSIVKKKIKKKEKIMARQNTSSCEVYPVPSSRAFLFSSSSMESQMCAYVYVRECTQR